MPKYFSRAAWVRCLPFAVFMAWLALRGAWPADGGSAALGIDPRWLYGAGALCTAALLVAYRREYGELSRQLLPTGREAAQAVAVGAIVFMLWILLDAPWMRIGEPTAAFVPLDARGQPDWPLLAVRWLGAALVVPLMEELFWRSFLMRWVQSQVFQGVPPQQVGLRAVVLSTFVFMLAHTLWLAAIVAGAAYAWLYIRSGKLWTAVLAHAVTNGLLGVWVVWTGRWEFW